MQKYMIAEIAGYQYRVEEGAKVTVPRLESEQGSKITLDKVLLVNAAGEVKVGNPYVEGASAEAKVLEHSRSRKVWVFKKKRRKGFKKSGTQRQHQTILEISGLSV
ncbi:50S ribosomal protein L21 [bacterium]|nr:50S ribosomal protein L21 [bacterium]